jgi:hypothetical protein
LPLLALARVVRVPVDPIYACAGVMVHPQVGGRRATDRHV